MLAGLFLWLLRRRQSACRRCPHDRGGHTSYIPGGTKPGYCAARGCGCWQYKPERPWVLAAAYLRQRPAPVPAPVVLRPRPVRFPLPDPAEYDGKTDFGFRVPPFAPRTRGGRQ